MLYCTRNCLDDEETVVKETTVFYHKNSKKGKASLPFLSRVHMGKRFQTSVSVSSWREPCDNQAELQGWSHMYTNVIHVQYDTDKSVTKVITCSVGY